MGCCANATGENGVNYPWDEVFGVHLLPFTFFLTTVDVAATAARATGDDGETFHSSPKECVHFFWSVMKYKSVISIVFRGNKFFRLIGSVRRGTLYDVAQHSTHASRATLYKYISILLLNCCLCRHLSIWGPLFYHSLLTLSFTLTLSLCLCPLSSGMDPSRPSFFQI